MSFKRPLTIKEVIENIHGKNYLLPAIQREFVWDTDQIERLLRSLGLMPRRLRRGFLLDSLMRDYPIGSFLFWHLEKDKIKDFQFDTAKRGLPPHRYVRSESPVH